MMLSVGQIIQQKVVGCFVNNELERMWKETDVAKFEILSQYCN
jgi:hypothetical protein